MTITDTWIGSANTDWGAGDPMAYIGAHQVSEPIRPCFRWGLSFRPDAVMGSIVSSTIDRGSFRARASHRLDGVIGTR